jgi:hypothetical protein
LTPDHNDLTQLWQAIQSLIAQKYITTPIVKTVHGPGADFNDLISAMAWLQPYIITATGYVTFIIAPGRWVYTQSVEINHANMNRVAIQGGALLGGSPEPGNLSVTGYHSATDGTNQIIYLRSVYATELAFTGGVAGFEIFQPGVTLRYLLITGSQTGGNGITVHQSGCYLDGIAVWGFGSSGLEILQGTVIVGTSLSVTFAYNGNCGISNQNGIYGGQASPVNWTLCTSNAVTGINNLGGMSTFGRVYVAGHGPPNGNAAIQSLEGGLIAANPGSQLQINQSGMIVAGAASVLFESAAINNNASYGVYVYGTATLWINQSTFSSNGTYDVIATNGAFVDATGASMAGNWTPAFNTYGTNNDAFMAH